MSIRLGVTVTAVEQTDVCAFVQLSDGTTGAFDVVVGADGANSEMRESLFGTACRPEYTGQAVWRATVSRPDQVQARLSYYGRRSKAGCNPVSRDKMYIYLQQNLPQFVRLADEELPASMRNQLACFGGVMARAREEIVSPDQIVYRPVVSHILPPAWYRGRVILVGDAAHTVTPHMATGAGMAIEDSIVLSSLMVSEPSLEIAFNKFMARRYERCRMVVENSRQLGEWEKDPQAANADPIGLLDKSLKALCLPM